MTIDCRPDRADPPIGKQDGFRDGNSGGKEEVAGAPMTDRLEEHESVVLKTENMNVPMPAGSKGAIVYIYDAYPPVYEVEFFDDDGNTIGVHTMPEADLRRGQARQIGLRAASPTLTLGLVRG